jgi:hypothetical protein
LGSPFKELYEAEHEKYVEVARRERDLAKTLNTADALISLALVCMKNELLEHDLLWDTRATIDTLERYIDDGHKRHLEGTYRKT